MNKKPNTVATIDASFQNVLDLSAAMTSSKETIGAEISEKPIKIDASLTNTLDTIDTSLTNLENDMEVDLHLSYQAEKTKILYNTTEYWNSRPSLMSKRGYIYVYSDWAQDSEGKDVAGLKVGDGKAYLIDLPFTEQILIDHLNDMVRHITEAEREFWNNKVRCYMEGQDRLVFTTN